MPPSWMRTTPGEDGLRLTREPWGKLEEEPRDPRLFVTVYDENYLLAGQIAP